MRKEEYLFGGGLVCMAAAAGICQFVIFGLIGVVLIPPAAALLIIAGVRARSLEASSLRRGLGIILLVAGVILLIGTAFYAGHLSFRFASLARMTAPTTEDWGILGISSLVPPLLMALGLRFLTDWPSSRCAGWGVGVLCVCPATILIFRVLATILPLSN